MRKALSAAGRARHDQSGITGLETAIVLIAFIVVAAVFAFAVLTTGLFTTERAKDTTISAVGEAQSTLSPKGAVIAEANVGLDGVDLIRFKLANASGAEGVDLAGATTLVTYSDANQSANVSFDAGADPAPPGLVAAGECEAARPDPLPDPPLPADDDICWSHAWIVGDGPTVDGGEIVEFSIQMQDLGGLIGTALGANTRFRIEVIPGQGAVIPISRKIPLEITAVMDLD